MRGAQRFFEDIFQETSSGDIGIEIPDGPIFRCHLPVLQAADGFLGKLREVGRRLPRTIEAHEMPISSPTYFKQKCYWHLLKEVPFARFTEAKNKSGLQGSGGVLAGLTEVRDPKAPGFNTSMLVSGSLGAVRNRDPFFLAERYQVDCDCELMVEVLRYIYKAEMDLEDRCPFMVRVPETDREKREHKERMLGLFLLAEKLSVDTLFEEVRRWFVGTAFGVIGEKLFADSYFEIQHAEAYECSEEFSRLSVRKALAEEFMSQRDIYKVVTRDSRWQSLPVDLMKDLLSSDSLAVAEETEVLNLIERWNVRADKKHNEVVMLLGCFRPDAETLHVLRLWLKNLGWQENGGSADGEVDEAQADMDALVRGVGSVGEGGKPKLPRGAEGSKPALEDSPDAFERQTSGATAAEEEAQSEGLEQNFVQYRGKVAVRSGFAFQLGAGQKLLQAGAIRRSGRMALRCSLSTKEKLWNPKHDVFIGIDYGAERHFGYIVGITRFHGIFSVKAVASAAPEAGSPVHLTGSGNKVELDVMLEVQYPRVNNLVVCKLCVIFNSERLAIEPFQVTETTLTSGPGLRYQVIGMGLDQDEVNVQLAWVSGGNES